MRTPDTKQRVAVLFRDGMSPADIATKLVVQRAYVDRLLVSAGLMQSPNANKACADGSNMHDPKRADRLLRRFSFQDAPE